MQVTITGADVGKKFTYNDFELKIAHVGGDVVSVGKNKLPMSRARLEQGFADGIAYWGHYSSSVADIVRSSGGSVSGEANGGE